MCDCYKIGGPFIAEDPDCPIHGREAQQEREYQNGQYDSLQMQIDDLEARIHRLEQIIERTTTEPKGEV